MPSSAKTVDEYLASLPPDRRAALTAVRAKVNARLPSGYEEGMLYGMPSWYVPMARFPVTYNNQPLCLASLGSQKNHMAIYMMNVYSDPATDKWFRAAYKAAGKKLDMGKSCVRFKKVDDLALDVIGDAIARTGVDAYCARVEAVMGSARKARRKPAATKKPAAKPKKKKRELTAKSERGGKRSEKNT